MLDSRAQRMPPSPRRGSRNYRFVAKRHSCSATFKLSAPPVITSPSPQLQPPRPPLVVVPSPPPVIFSIDDIALAKYRHSSRTSASAFQSLNSLLRPDNLVYLAVFLNYLLIVDEASALFFYLISILYEQGDTRELRRWAYEIHSTFLVPACPLAWYKGEHSLVALIDTVLENHYETDQAMRAVFKDSRARAVQVVVEQLKKFRMKRNSSLDIIYGPSDLRLRSIAGDYDREQYFFTNVLMRRLYVMIDDYQCDMSGDRLRTYANCCALLTVLHHIFSVRPRRDCLIETTIAQFVSEKSFKSRLRTRDRTVSLSPSSTQSIRRGGHNLTLRQYYVVTFCDYCQHVIWGISPQGRNCSNCNGNYCNGCCNKVREPCPGRNRRQTRRRRKRDHDPQHSIGRMRKVKNFAGAIPRFMFNACMKTHRGDLPLDVGSGDGDVDGQPQR